MKRLFLTFAMVSAAVVLGMGCATTKQEKSQAPAPSKAPPAAASQQPEIVTPPVTLPPDQTAPPSGSQ